MKTAFLAIALIGMSAAAQAGGYGHRPRPTPPSHPIDVPEPGAMVLAAGGALAMIARRIRAGRA